MFPNGTALSGMPIAMPEPVPIVASHGKWFVKMSTVQLFLFAYLTGLTVAGLFGAIAEAIVRRPVGFNDPFVREDRLLASLAVTAFGGPAMLLNDTLVAWKAGAFPFTGLLGVAALANAWALALGILVLEIIAPVLW